MNSYKIITEKMVFGGNCIAKNNGKTVFVPFALPGEELEVENVASHRDYDTARIVNVINASENRVEPVCPLYQKCGGCNMMHVEPKAQIELRKQMLLDAFERNGIKDLAVEVVSDSSLGYRSRFQLHDGGLEQRSTNQVIHFDECPIAEKPVNQWLRKTPVSRRPRGRCHVFASENVVCASGIEGNKIAVSQEVQKSQPHVVRKGKNYKTSRKVYSGTMISPADAVTVSILGKRISFDSRGFFQSNMKVLEKSIGFVVNGLKGDSVLDMYSGCGTFSVFLSDFFQNVTLVEHNRDALVYAEQNLAGKMHKSFGLSGARFVQSYPDVRFDAVVVDPPRSGMEKEVLDYLCKAKIPQIRSVSCDPATHARDAAALVKAGYKIEKLFLLDFYPNTSHIESLAWFTYEK